MKNFLIKRIIVMVFLFVIAGTGFYYNVNKDKVNYVSPYTYKEYDTSVYDMDRSKINIGVFDYNANVQSEEKIQEFVDFGGNFIIHGGKSEEFLNLCAKYDIGVIVANLNAKRYTTGTHYLSMVEPIETYNDLGERYINNDSIIGDDIFDEPSAVFFPRFQTIVEIYREQMPKKIPYFNLHPLNKDKQNTIDHYIFYGADTYQEYIDNYCNTVDTDYICYDVYPFDNFSVGIYNAYLENMDIVATACRESGRDFWIISQAGGNKPENVLNKSQMSWQSYLSLAYGAVAITHACYTPCWWADNTSIVTQKGVRNDLWEITKNLNNEIHSLSDTYMQYRSTGVFTVGGTETLKDQMIAQNERSAARGFTKKTAEGFRLVQTDDAVLVGCFDKKDGDGSAAMFVNMVNPYDMNADATVTFRTEGIFPKKVTAYIGGIAKELKPSLLGVYTLNLSSGEGVFVIVE